MSKVGLGFGDVVEYDGLKLFIIGEHINSTVDNQLVIGANTKYLGIVLQADKCQKHAAGYHTYCRDLQRKFIEQFPYNMILGM